MNTTQRLFQIGTILAGSYLAFSQGDTELDLSTRKIGAPPHIQTVDSLLRWLENPAKVKCEISVTNLVADADAYMEIHIGDQQFTFYGVGVDEFGEYAPTNYAPVTFEANLRREYQ